jgi:[ribosomal protein S5]-alanine N-acetyltransferase
VLQGLTEHHRATEQPTLYSQRLALRPFALSDAPRVTELLQTPEISENTLNFPYPYEEHMAVTWIETLFLNFENGLGFNCAITLRETGELIGTVGLYTSTRHSHAGVGYWLGRDYWNSGYTTEAVSTLFDYGFDVLGLNRIYCDHFVRNPASGRVMQKLGMKHEGTLRQHYRKGDHYEDVATYGLLRDEWLNRER